MLVEFVTDKFQFYKDDKPTGHYARGIIVKEYPDKKTYLIECLSNGIRYEVKNNEFKIL